jgi:hypothetical protein
VGREEERGAAIAEKSVPTIGRFQDEDFRSKRTMPSEEK